MPGNKCSEFTTNFVSLVAREMKSEKKIRSWLQPTTIMLISKAIIFKLLLTCNEVVLLSEIRLKT